MRSLYDHIYAVQCPCEIRNSKGELLYQREVKSVFVIPLPSDAVVVRGKAKLLGVCDNFFNISPPMPPLGWDLKARLGEVSRIAEIGVDDRNKKGRIILDKKVFDDPGVPEGCKVFMLFHEIGHPIYKSDEAACDEFAFWHGLRAGVTPYNCFLALAGYMPEHYSFRVERLGNLIVSNSHLRKFTDGNAGSYTRK